MMRDVRNWAGVVTSDSSGVWAVDFTKAGITEVLNVVATAQANTASVNSMPFTTVTNFDNKSARGRVLIPNTLNFFLGGTGLGMKISSSPTTVYVQVIGY